jgi:folate-binding protein YgfZ
MSSDSAPSILATTAADSPAWRALTEGAAWFERPQAGVLVLEDDDRVDFLQRMTSADIKALRPGQAAVTVLTSPTARIVHVFAVLCRADDLLLLPAPDDGAALERHLRNQIFFMDKVRVRNVGDSWRRMRLTGPQAAQVALAALGLQPAATDGLWVEHAAILAWADGRYEWPGLELLVPAEGEAVSEVARALAAAGAVEVADAALLEARRIELGLPAVGAELTGEVNPLEGGLGWACADNKGCYTGQEIIARQITYDKVTRSLVGLRADLPLVAGVSLFAEGREVGVVTSAAHSPTLGCTIALAIVRRSHTAPGSRVTLQSADGPAAEVVALPHAEG